MPASQLPTIETAFLSAKPFEPVLVFAPSDEASQFQEKVSSGRILPDQNLRWVFLPLPNGLLHVRTMTDGTLAFGFESSAQAKAFNSRIWESGRVYQATREKPELSKTVYVGKRNWRYRVLRVCQVIGGE